MPIKRNVSVVGVNGLLSSFPFFPFLFSVLSLQKNFSAALKRLQVLFIFTFSFPPILLLPSKPQGFLLFFFVLKWLIYRSPTCWGRSTHYWASSDSPSFESLRVGSKQRNGLKGVSFLVLFTPKETAMRCAGFIMLDIHRVCMRLHLEMVFWGRKTFFFFLFHLHPLHFFSSEWNLIALLFPPLSLLVCFWWVFAMCFGGGHGVFVFTSFRQCFGASEM